MSLPTCEVCKKLNGIDKPADYEALTFFGFYAFMCESHWEKHAVSGKKLRNKVRQIRREYLPYEVQENERYELFTTTIK